MGLIIPIAFLPLPVCLAGYLDCKQRWYLTGDW